MADFLTLHVVKTPETLGMIGEDLLAKAKPSLRIVNVSRGGVIDEDALAEAIREGRIAGAALDVFATEPTTESPLFELPQVVVTPHLGRQHRRGAGQGRATPSPSRSASPWPASSCPSPSTSPRPRRRARCARSCRWPSASASSTRRWPPASPTCSRSGYEGQLADADTRILTLSVLKGVFGRVSEEPVSYVNAPAPRRRARRRGARVLEPRRRTTT